MARYRYHHLGNDSLACTWSTATCMVSRKQFCSSLFNSFNWFPDC